MIQDPGMHSQILELIQTANHRAETAVEQVLEGMASMLAGADDPLLAERSADLRDLAMRLKSKLSNRRSPIDMETEQIAGTGAVLAVPELLTQHRARGLAAWRGSFHCATRYHGIPRGYLGQVVQYSGCTRRPPEFGHTIRGSKRAGVGWRRGPGRAYRGRACRTATPGGSPSERTGTRRSRGSCLDQYRRSRAVAGS
jgi:hypothetical protein